MNYAWEEDRSEKTKDEMAEQNTKLYFKCKQEAQNGRSWKN